VQHYAHVLAVSPSAAVYGELMSARSFAGTLMARSSPRRRPDLTVTAGWLSSLPAISAADLGDHAGGGVVRRYRSVWLVPRLPGNTGSCSPTGNRSRERLRSSAAEAACTSSPIPAGTGLTWTISRDDLAPKQAAGGR
jgi:hypothetical protein